MRFESCSTRRRRFGSPRIGNTVDLAVSTNKNNNDDDDDVAQSIIIFQILIGLSRKEGQSAVDGRNASQCCQGSCKYIFANINWKADRSLCEI